VAITVVTLFMLLKPGNAGLISGHPADYLSLIRYLGKFKQRPNKNAFPLSQLNIGPVRELSQTKQPALHGGRGLKH
jgi:hypothetical protein